MPQPTPTQSSPRSTPSSGRWRRPCTGRCACSRVPAPARPAPSPTGSPTASTPGSYSRSTVLAVTFTARAAGEMRSRLRELGVGGVQARTFHAAALRQLQYFWPRAVGGEAPAARSTTRRRCVAEAAGRLRLPLDRPRLRDLAAEIEWAKVTLLVARRLRRGRDARPAATPPAGLDLAAIARLFAAYEEVKRASGRHRLRGRAAAHRRRARGPRATSPSEVRGAVPALRRRRVPGRQPAAAAAARPVARRAATTLCVVGDPSQTIYSFTGATPRYLLGVPRRGSRARRSCGWSATTARRRRSSRWPTVSLSGAPAVRGRRALELVAQRAAGPGAAVRRATPTSRPRPPASPRAVRGAASTAGDAAGRDRGAVPDQRPVRGLRAGAGRRRACPTSLRGGERFFDRARGPPGGPAAARRGPRVGRRRRQACPASVRATSSPRPAGPPARPPGGGAARERWESLAALVPRWPTTSRPPRPEATLADARRRARGARGGAARPDRRGRDARVAARGQGPGVGRRVPRRRWSTGMVPISHAPTAEAGRGGAPAALRRRDPRARAPVAVLVAGAQPGGRATRQPSRFLDGLRPAMSATRRSASRSAAAAKGRGRGRVGRTAGAAAELLPRRPQRKLGRCDDCPPTYDEALFERLRAWRLARSRADRGARLRRVHRRDARRRIAECAAVDARGAVADRGVGGQARALRRRRAGARRRRVRAVEERSSDPA